MSGASPVVCSICTELFIFSNQHEESQLIAAAPCGHTFHMSCLNQWLANSSTCPQCRTSTKKNKITRLFFDFPAFNDTDCSQTMADGAITRLNVRINELTDQLQAKSTALEKARTEAGRLAEHLASSKDLFAKAKSTLEDEKQKNKILRQRFEELTVKSDKADDLMRRNEAMAKKLSLLDGLQKVALEECEQELEKLLQSGSSDPREISTWLAVTSRELKSSQSKVKSLTEELKKLRDRVASEKVRCSSLSEELRKRTEDLTRCENELKSVEERLKRTQTELAKYRAAPLPQSDEFSPPPRIVAAKPGQSVSSACRDIFESPAAQPLPSNVALKITPGLVGPSKGNKENDDDGDCLIVETQSKKSRLAEIASTSTKEASPVTPNSMTDFRKLATKALNRVADAKASGATSAAANVPPPPMRRGYNGLGGHSMTFAFPVGNNNSQNAMNKPKSFLTFPSQPAATKRKL